VLAAHIERVELTARGNSPRRTNRRNGISPSMRDSIPRGAARESLNGYGAAPPVAPCDSGDLVLAAEAPRKAAHLLGTDVVKPIKVDRVPPSHFLFDQSFFSKGAFEQQLGTAAERVAAGPLGTATRCAGRVAGSLSQVPTKIVELPGNIFAKRVPPTVVEEPSPAAAPVPADQPAAAPASALARGDSFVLQSGPESSSSDSRRAGSASDMAAAIADPAAAQAVLAERLARAKRNASSQAVANLAALGQEPPNVVSWPSLCRDASP